MDHTVSVSAINEKVLKHRAVDIDKWLQDVVDGQIAAVRRDIIDYKTNLLRADASVATMPANEDAILNEIFDANGYLNAADDPYFDESIPR